MRLSLLVPAVLALGSMAAAQVTYYADPVNGSDTNPGTSRSTAVRSISFGVTLLADNDTLVLLPGTFSPTLTGETYPIRIGDTGSQANVTIRSDQGPQVTILDGEQGATSSGVPLLRFYGGGIGGRLIGLQILNATASPPNYWSMAIRLGSTSGGNFETQDIEITKCIFRNGYRGIVIFGSNNSVGGTSTSGCKIHDNLFENNAHRSIAAWGDGDNYIFNNTFVGGGYEGIFLDSLGAGSGQGPNTMKVYNNIIEGCSNVGNLGGLSVGAQSAGHTPTVENNLAFNNGGGDYVGFSPTPSNLVADPMFVGGGDYHLQAGSPAVQSGSSAVLPMARVDLDGFSRAHDSDGDLVAQIDRGAYQYTQYGMTVSGTWVPGGAVNFSFAAPAGGGASLIFGWDDGAIPLGQFGILGIASNAIIVATSAGGAPGNFSLNIPNDPNLTGLLVVQGVYIGPAGPIHLLNVVEPTF